MNNSEKICKIEQYHKYLMVGERLTQKIYKTLTHAKLQIGK